MKKILLALMMVSLTVGSIFAQAQQEYPSRDITDIVVWGAGGGTDSCNRIIMEEMGKVLDVNINVNNVTGGKAGMIGMTEAYNKPADGYTLCGLSESNTTAAVYGWDHTMDVWDFFIVGGSPDILSVTPDSPYQTLEDLVKASISNPNSIKAGAGGPGSIHHLNLLAFMEGSGVQLAFIPYDGSAGSQNAAMTGEITVVITSVAEQAEMIKAGKLRPLAMMTPDAYTLASTTIPSSFDMYPELSNFLPLGQQIGFAVRADVPEANKTILENAFSEAMQSDAVKAFGEQHYYNLSGKYGEEAKEIFKNLESKFSWTLSDLGSAEVDPATLGIARK
ncbi:MAG: tripartite tricarboxylate transporter substrate binding protein [Sphaerochaetaceae bacterium]|nr:tripartite tricarboxylate transporter substrate binding protein [Sphaerochaetaceae bacterium]